MASEPDEPSGVSVAIGGTHDSCLPAIERPRSPAEQSSWRGEAPGGQVCATGDAVRKLSSPQSSVKHTPTPSHDCTVGDPVDRGPREAVAERDRPPDNYLI